MDAVKIITSSNKIEIIICPLVFLEPLLSIIIKVFWYLKKKINGSL